MARRNGSGSWTGIFGRLCCPMKILYAVISLFTAAFLSLQILIFLEIPLPSWATGYVNDFLCMPLVLFFCLKTLHLLKKDSCLKLPLFIIIALTSFYALYFELYLPKVNPRYTADMWDVVMYFSGGLLFYFLQFQK